MSLRSATAWAGLNGVAAISDVALLKRLRGSADWLGDIAGALLRKASDTGNAAVSRRLRIVDGSSISRPGSAGTDFRLHAAYEPALARFTHLEFTDVHGGESFSRIPVVPGDIVLDDRAYARAPALYKVVSAGADFIMRMAWSNVRLTSLDGRLIDWNAIYSTMMPGDMCEHEARRGSPSLWRLHSLLKHTILSAILTVQAAKKISTRFSAVMRHICDPPRRRESQATAARNRHKPLS